MRLRARRHCVAATPATCYPSFPWRNSSEAAPKDSLAPLSEVSYVQHRFLSTYEMRQAHSGELGIHQLTEQAMVPDEARFL